MSGFIVELGIITLLYRRFIFSASVSKAAGPLYEEVDLAAPAPRGQDIQMESNEAYGQVRSYN